jgi:hypothetical protein
MFNNESVMKSIARRVFPDLGAFSKDWVAKLGVWDAVFYAGRDAAWLTISHGQDVLFRIETHGGHVEATYALPAVMERGNGEKFYGTAWANSRRWRVDGWSDVPGVAQEIREFFDNIDEFLEEEAKVYKVLEETK